MGKSLQEQLLSLGLAREPIAGKSRREERAGRTERREPPRHAPRPGPEQRASQRPRAGAAGQRSGKKAETSGDELSLAQAFALRQQQEKQEAERARAEKRAADLERQRLNRIIRELTVPYRLNDPQADLPRHFLDRGRIRKVNVTASQLADLNQGRLGLVYVAGAYHLLDLARVEQVRALAPDHVPDLSGSPESGPDDGVPDDLVW